MCITHYCKLLTENCRIIQAGIAQDRAPVKLLKKCPIRLIFHVESAEGIVDKFINNYNMIDSQNSSMAGCSLCLNKNQKNIILLARGSAIFMMGMTGGCLNG